MSRVCDLTGKRAMVGNNVSHAMNKTKRKFSVNLLKKRFYLPEKNRWITLRVAASTIKTKKKKNTPDRLEIKKFNPILKRVTVHKEIK